MFLPSLKLRRVNRKIGLFILIISLLVFGYFSWQKLLSSSCKNRQAVKYKLENKNYCLLMADSPDEWTKGLMGVKKPVNFDGMIFIFPNKEPRIFWNMNTFIDLDIYWLDNENKVGKSQLPSIEKSGEVVRVSSEKDINKVIEIIR